MNTPVDSTIAVVGDGFGSLMVYATAIYLGFDKEQLAIYGPSSLSRRRKPERPYSAACYVGWRRIRRLVR